MSNLLQEIEAQISGAKTEVAKENVGIVREAGDGVAKIEGLTGAMMNEMLDFGNGVTGLALNLEETEVGAIVLGRGKRLPSRHRLRRRLVRLHARMRPDDLARERRPERPGRSLPIGAVVLGRRR